ncbi:lipoprotein insertase outer membrane protein LolB, partial [Pseudomonas viridiflava]|uniref:lipoprotein insertase outer membrane protein LolB n=1 Tax=Pseudomonas viridiflava TaxID=33069 RepID=UPI000F06451F
MRLRHLIVIGLLAVLSGCAGLTSHESLDGQGDPAKWQAHKTRTVALNGWQISGKVGIRAPKDSGSGTLFWL